MHFFFIRDVWCVYEIWQMLLTPLPDVKKQSSGQPTDAGRHWTKFGHGWTNFGKWWGSYNSDGGFRYLCLQWHWCLIAMLLLVNIIAARYSLRAPNMHALCEAYSWVSTLNSLWIVIGGIHQVFATPKRNRMLYVRETALPIQFLDHHACRF